MNSPSNLPAGRLAQVNMRTPEQQLAGFVTTLRAEDVPPGAQFPAALAAAELAGGCSGDEFMAALVAGAGLNDARELGSFPAIS